MDYISDHFERYANEVVYRAEVVYFAPTKMLFGEYGYEKRVDKYTKRNDKNGYKSE